MFTASIVGRPNVGKSTLFNRLSLSIKAIVQDTPGVTRDVKESPARIGDLQFKLADTAGLDFLAKKDKLLAKTIIHTEALLAKTDVILFVVDGKVGVTGEDKSYADWLRKKELPVILLVNKFDCKEAQNNLSEFYRLGFKQMVAISAEHNQGMGELYNYLTQYDQKEEVPAEQDRQIKITIMGRPNVGKSTFINQLLQEERLLTGPEPGITRDTIAINWQWKGYNLQLIDTAGIRKKNNIYEFLEKLSVGQSLQSIKMAHIVVLMVDVTMPLERQDLSIANLAYEQGKPVVLAVNKSDLIEDKTTQTQEIIFKAKSMLNHLGNGKINFISALHKKELSSVLDNCVTLFDKWQTHIPTSKLNAWLSEALAGHALPLLHAGRRVRIKFMNQLKTKPPTFQLFTNRPDKISQSYITYLTNSLRSKFDLDGVPIRFVMKKIDNPYDK